MIDVAQVAAELGKEAKAHAGLVQTYEQLSLVLAPQSGIHNTLASARRRLDALTAAHNIFQALATGGCDVDAGARSDRDEDVEGWLFGKSDRR